MKISRIVIKNYRSFAGIDFRVDRAVCNIIGENNTGKSAVLKAIRLCLDNALSNTHRILQPEDIHSGVDTSKPFQVLIGVEFSDFEREPEQEAMLSVCKIGPDRARVCYRFRPKGNPSTLPQMTSHDTYPFNSNNYTWELTGGGHSELDLLGTEWDQSIGYGIQLKEFQPFLVVHIPALRDVEADIRNSRNSPIMRLIDACDLDSQEQEILTGILQTANDEIGNAESIRNLSNRIDQVFKEMSGPAFEMDSMLGLSSATFRAILRNLKLLLSDQGLSHFELYRNGDGMNNILFVALWVTFLKQRIATSGPAGHVVLFEEPEAHLHPQLQLSLMSSMKDLDVQVIMTSHSTQLASRAGLASMVTLTKQWREEDVTPAVVASNFLQDNKLSAKEVCDLDRFLDATRSDILFARKVMLVEGPSELFLISAMIEQVWNERPERHGISIIAIFGRHFRAYTKLFQEGLLEKKCAVVGDGDAEKLYLEKQTDDQVQVAKSAESTYVKCFWGKATFEKNIAFEENLGMIISAARELSKQKVPNELENAREKLSDPKLSERDRKVLLEEIQERTLAVAQDCGKARFAQVCARHVGECERVPEYIREAYEWLLT